MLKTFHGCDGIFVVIEGGQTEVIFTVFAEACAWRSDNLGVI